MKLYKRLINGGRIQRGWTVHSKPYPTGEVHLYLLFSIDPSNGIKKIRRVEAVDPDQAKVPTLPVEWMSKIFFF